MKKWILHIKFEDGTGQKLVWPGQFDDFMSRVRSKLDHLGKDIEYFFVSQERLIPEQGFYQEFDDLEYIMDQVLLDDRS